jgi:hypothetical protein
MIVIFLIVKCYSIEIVVGISVLFTILHKKNGFSKLIKNGNMLSNKDFKSMFIKLLMCFYIMIQLPINCILMSWIIYFIFEAQINYMGFLKRSKMNEILHVTTFYIICSLNFPKKSWNNKSPRKKNPL